MKLELDNAIYRMGDARWNKARRGELMTIPPARYDIDDLHQLVMSGDEAIVHAIRTVFDRFEQLGRTSARIPLESRPRALRTNRASPAPAAAAPEPTRAISHRTV